MLQSTTQSRKVQLTEEEKNYFVKTTDEDLLNIFNTSNESRKHILREIGNDDVSVTDHYNHQAQCNNDTQGTHHIYPAYDDPFGDTAFRIGIRLLAEVISRRINDRNALLLDTGSGSGYLAAEAKKLGFNNIDCLEPNQSMIDKQPTGLFGKVYKEVKSLAKPCSIKSESYDCVMSNGSILSGHIEVEDVPEVLRIVKPGGFVIFNIPDFWYKHDNFGARLDATFQAGLESGKLDTVVKERSAYWYPMEDATIYVLCKAM